MLGILNKVIFQIMKCNESDDNLEKCTICLCEFEDEEDVRYLFKFFSFNYKVCSNILLYFKNFFFIDLRNYYNTRKISETLAHLNSQNSGIY